jgi:hypothetical protein
MAVKWLIDASCFVALPPLSKAAEGRGKVMQYARRQTHGMIVLELTLG